MSKKQIDKINKACKEIEKKRDNYRIEVLKFFHEVYLIKEKSRKLNLKNSTLDAFLDKKVHIITVGYLNRRNNLIKEYVAHKQILLDLKKRLLVTENPEMITIGNRLAKDIKRLKDEISSLKEEIKNADSKIGKRR